jgi:hypothetical protein
VDCPGRPLQSSLVPPSAVEVDDARALVLGGRGGGRHAPTLMLHLSGASGTLGGWVGGPSCAQHEARQCGDGRASAS